MTAEVLLFFSEPPFLTPFFGASIVDSPSANQSSMWQGDDMYGLILPCAR